jgi:RNA polymerase sigma-70 factor (ECF subfamily)
MNETVPEHAPEIQLFDRLKPELKSYCYKMLGSMEDAEDAVQETLIRVWQNWNSFRKESSSKTWIYRITTNICVDKLRQVKRRTRPVDFSSLEASNLTPSETLTDSIWIWPAPTISENPEDILIRKETLQLCFVTLLQILPLRQRTVLILKDVFEWPSKQIAETLEISSAAVNSALQRARKTMDQAKPGSEEYSLVNVEREQEQELVSRYVEAFERYDSHALAALFRNEGNVDAAFHNVGEGKVNMFNFFSHTRCRCERCQEEIPN